MPYTAQKPGHTPTSEELRGRIPGWGADLDPADRPAVPREQPGIETGAHWELPEQQLHIGPRERSLEHERLTPVFGTAQPLRGAAGAIRRYAYAKYSEGQAAHWLLLIAADRVESATAHVKSLFSRRPDDPLTQSGILIEWRAHPVASRLTPGRIDGKHTWMDPIIVLGPWIAAGALIVAAVRAATTPSARPSRR